MILRHRHALPLTRPAVSSRGGLEKAAEIEPSKRRNIQVWNGQILSLSVDRPANEDVPTNCKNVHYHQNTSLDGLMSCAC